MSEDAKTPNIPMRDIFDTINDNYYRLTASEKKVADYVIIHRSAVQFMSISELAEACEVAEATVSRFCRRLKLRGYNAFKLALAKSAGDHSASAAGFPLEPLEREILPEDSIEEMSRKLLNANVEALMRTNELIRPERIQQAADLLTQANMVYCMGQGGSVIIAEEAAHLFSTIAPNYFCVEDSHMQATAAALLETRDVLMFFSYSGSTKDIVDVMALAKARGAKTILFTRFTKSPGTVYADVVLQCGANEGPLQLGSVEARVAQLFLIDVLFQEVCRRMGPKAQENRELIANALADKHL